MLRIKNNFLVIHSLTMFKKKNNAFVIKIRRSLEERFGIAGKGNSEWRERKLSCILQTMNGDELDALAQSVNKELGGTEKDCQKI